MSKVLLKVNEHKISTLKQETEKVCKVLNDAVKTVGVLTEDKVSVLDLKKIEKALNKRSGFLNAEMSAYAFNLKSEYLQVKSIIEQGVDKTEYVTIKSGTYTVDTQAILDDNTSYMREKNVEHYETFKKALELMETVPYDVKKLVDKCVKRDGSLNAEQFNLFCNLNSRIAR